MNSLKSFLFFVLILFCSNTYSQSRVDIFLKPSDSLNSDRVLGAKIFQGVTLTGTVLALGSVWYNDYDKSEFHLYNDNAEWLQMDKIGHVFSGYQISRFSSDIYKWSGINDKKSAIYGATSGFLFLTSIEVLDGFSKEWGFSYGDIISNFLGSSMYLGQELLWNEQRIAMKYSFKATPYASRRPGTLGSSYTEQMLKDYNGQTYWLSFNLNSFIKSEFLPNWLNFAVGYGAEGMITGHDHIVNTIFLPENERFRQFYLSFDIDCTKINTKSHLLKTIFSVINSIKIPAPTIEFSSKYGSKFIPIHF